MATINETKAMTPTEKEKKFIATFISESAEKFLTKDKEIALAKNKEYQELKAKVAKLEAEICAQVTNKAYARKLAVNYGKKWEMDANTLERLIIDENGTCIKDGKKFALYTISKCASFMVYLHKNLTRSIKEVIDKQDKLAESVLGGLFWTDDLQAVYKKVAEQENTTLEIVQIAYEKYQARKAKAKEIADAAQAKKDERENERNKDLKERLERERKEKTDFQKMKEEKEKAKDNK